MERKLFAPDLMFNNYVKSCWCDNIETTSNGKLPLNKELMEKGVYAIEIKPKREKEWFAFSFPINKKWKDEDFFPFYKSKLSFNAVGCDSFKLDVVLMDENKNQKRFQTEVPDTGNWNKIEVPLLNDDLDKIQMIMFSGSSNSISHFLIQNVKIEG